MAIVNKHPTKNLKVDNENSYLFNYLDTLGLDIEVHNDFVDLKNVLTNKEDYPYSFDNCFEIDNFTDTSKGFVFYLKDGDKIVSTYAARAQTPSSMKDGLSRVYSNFKTENLHLI